MSKKRREFQKSERAEIQGYKEAAPGAARTHSYELPLALALLFLAIMSWYGVQLYSSLIDRETRAIAALERGEQYDMVLRAYNTFQVGVEKEYENCLDSMPQEALDVGKVAYCKRFTAWAKEVLGETR